MESLQNHFEKGLTTEEFENSLGENRALHERHYIKNDVTGFQGKYIGRINDFKIIVITEPWCGDSLAIVPTLLKFFESFPSVDIRFVPRDENTELIDRYLTNGGRAIPKMVVMDKGFNELFSWGPRPKVTQQILELNREKIKNGEVEKMEIMKKIRTFYSKDKGQAILDDFLSVLETYI